MEEKTLDESIASIKTAFMSIEFGYRIQKFRASALKSMI
jgi:hypothetical protein